MHPPCHLTACKRGSQSHRDAFMFPLTADIFSVFRHIPSSVRDTREKEGCLCRCVFGNLPAISDVDGSILCCGVWTQRPFWWSRDPQSSR